MAKLLNALYDVGNIYGQNNAGIVLFGDSITGYCGGTSETNQGQNLDASWWLFAQTILKYKIPLIKNLGIPGSTVLDCSKYDPVNKQVGLTNPMVYRYKKVLELNPQFIYMMAGVNDCLNSGAFGNPPSDDIADAIFMIADEFLLSGATLILSSVYPRALSNIENIRIRRLNKLIRDWARNRKNCVFLNASEFFTDFAGSDQGIKAIYTEDNLHPNSRAVIGYGKKVGGILDKLVPDDSSVFVQDQNDNFAFDATALGATSAVRSGGLLTVTTTNRHTFNAGQYVGFFRFQAGAQQLNEAFFSNVISNDSLTQFTLSSPGPDAVIDSGTILTSGNLQLFDNPLFMTTTGGSLGTNSSGVAAGGVRFVGDANTSIVGSIVPRVDGFGNNQRATITCTSSGTATILLRQGVNGILVPNTPAALYASLMLSILSATNGAIQSVDVFIRSQDGVNTLDSHLISHRTNSGIYTADDIVDLPVYSTYTHDLGDARLLGRVMATGAIYIVVTFASAGSCIIDAGRVGLFVVDKSQKERAV